MLEAKQGKLSIVFERTSYVGDVAVCLSFKCKLSACCLIKLKCGCKCGCFPSGSEEACVAYAIYLTVRNSLCGDPLATKKSKVSDVYCGYNDGEFSISWRVKATGSAVRKSIGIALKCLAPAKTYAGYSYCVKEAGGKANRDHFTYAANNIAKGINSGVQCAVVGGIRLRKVDPKTKKEMDAIDAADMLSVLSKKLNAESDGKGSENKDHVNCSHDNHVELKCSGVDAVMLKDYIMAKLKGVAPVICDKTLLVPLKESVWDTASKKLKNAVKDYVAMKYAPVGGELAAVLGYRMLSEAEAGAEAVRDLVAKGDRLKASDIEKILSDKL